MKTSNVSSNITRNDPTYVIGDEYEVDDSRAGMTKYINERTGWVVAESKRLSVTISNPAAAGSVSGTMPANSNSLPLLPFPGSVEEYDDDYDDDEDIPPFNPPPPQKVVEKKVDPFDEYLKQDKEVIPSNWDSDVDELNDSLKDIAPKKSVMTDEEYAEYQKKAHEQMQAGILGGYTLTMPKGYRICPRNGLVKDDQTSDMNDKKKIPDPNGDWKEYNDYLKKCNESLNKAVKRLSNEGLAAATTTKPKAKEDESSRYSLPKSLFDYVNDTIKGPATQKSDDSECVYHDWQLYKGFNHDDYYCTKCGLTKPVEPK